MGLPIRRYSAMIKHVDYKSLFLSKDKQKYDLLHLNR